MIFNITVKPIVFILFAFENGFAEINFKTPPKIMKMKATFFVNLGSYY